MKSFRFRILFHLSTPGELNSPETEDSVEFFAGHQLTLKPVQGDKPIRESDKLLLTAGGYGTEDEAWRDGQLVKEALLVASARYRVLVDAGNDTSHIHIGGFVKDKIWKKDKIRILEQAHGLQVYDESIKTSFAAGSKPKLALTHSTAKFLEEIKRHCLRNIRISERDLLAAHLFGASGFETSVRSRFLSLMLSIESMLEPAKRSASAIEIIDATIAQVKNRDDLSSQERDSLEGSLNWLKSESISSTGKKLAQRLLPDKKYCEMSSKKFFAHCYQIRSNLVHTGSPEIDEEQFGRITANLEVFVSDMLIAKFKEYG